MEIAHQRGLTVSTVEGHLAAFIFTGEIELKELVEEKKIGAIMAVIKETGAGALGPIRSRLGDGYSFGEIRAVVNYFKYTAKTS
jgi:ATP-dependent DNA helicase RecQ